MCVFVSVFVCVCGVAPGTPFPGPPSAGPPKISLFFPFSGPKCRPFLLCLGSSRGIVVPVQGHGSLKMCVPTLRAPTFPPPPFAPPPFGHPLFRAPTLRAPYPLGPPLFLGLGSHSSVSPLLWAPSFSALPPFAPQKQIGLSRTWPE